MEGKLFVTVSVTAYNSSKTILETLESIKAQTYPYLILQISDDHSTDNTIEICESWISKNKGRFAKTRVLTIDHNTGVSANCNRAWRACETDFFKGIAGDDLLLPNCIEEYVSYVKSNPDALVVFAKAKPFSVVFGTRIYKPYSHNYDFFQLSSIEQLNYLIYRGNNLPAASVFYNVRRLLELGFEHDERIRNLEDYPKWINLLRLGVRFHYIDRDTVLYRQQEGSLSVGLFSPPYFNQEIMFYLRYMLDDVQTESEKEKVYQAIADRLSGFYGRAYHRATQSRPYKIGHAILWPVRMAKLIVVVLKSFGRK